MSEPSLTRVVGIDNLARVEGEGAVHVTLSGDQVTNLTLDIFEPPRFFEAMLVGRAASEAPDITSRICGICPVAYQLTACAAVEDACGVLVPREISNLRRLLYCGEWLQSHALHIYLLHAPDFFGYADAVELAAHDRAALERGLRLKQTGNQLMSTIGGRAIHPVNLRVGGFYRAPEPSAIEELRAPLRRALDDALETVEWVRHFEFPDLEQPYRFVALRAEEDYAIESGAVALLGGATMTLPEFAARATEFQVEHSTALHAHLDGAPYLTGPLARFAINEDRMPPLSGEVRRALGMAGPCRNPFKSIVVRAIELVVACEEALRLLETYEPPQPPATDVPLRAGTGFGATEAPRGLLLNTYELDHDGTIARARIMPPTAQNQASIEADLRSLVGARVEDESRLVGTLERAVRNHDPCISCAAHFLDLELRRT